MPFYLVAHRRHNIILTMPLPTEMSIQPYLNFWHINFKILLCMAPLLLSSFKFLHCYPLLNDTINAATETTSAKIDTTRLSLRESLSPSIYILYRTVKFRISLAISFPLIESISCMLKFSLAHFCKSHGFLSPRSFLNAERKFIVTPPSVSYQIHPLLTSVTTYHIEFHGAGTSHSYDSTLCLLHYRS